MKGGMGVVLAHCTLCYFQKLIQLMLELVFILFIKKDVTRVRFGTRTQTTT